ncbi:UNVERIFIED_CONTAM: hypothetical protein FKN15_066776 [Acipenser sinensis]
MQGVWQPPWNGCHINVLELQAVYLSLQKFLEQVRVRRHVLICTDNMSVVPYINHQDGLRSPSLHCAAHKLLLWAQVNLLSLRAVQLPGVTNCTADLLSRGVPSGAEWKLYPEVVSLGEQGAFNSPLLAQESLVLPSDPAAERPAVGGAFMHGDLEGQYVTVEQLTLDFEYVINEVIRNDAAWSKQFCSFSDYDIVILEVCPEMNQVVINIGLLLLAFPTPEEGQIRPNTYHTSLKVSWDLSTGAFRTVGVGDLTEVKVQSSGSVWTSYRKSCVNTVMKWLVPENSTRYINRMTNEALHKGSSLKVLADGDRYTWIVL